MKKYIKILVVLMAVLLLPVPAAFSYEDGDFQIWHTEVQDIALHKKAKLAFEEEFRYGDNASELYYQHYDAGISYSLNDYLNFSINYRQVYDLVKGKFKPEYRPHMNGTIRWGVSALKFEDRNRFEYRIFDDRGAFVYYRNKFTAKFPQKFGKLEFEPYISDEIFADLAGCALKRNRLYFGMAVNLTKNIKPEIYYLRQDSKSRSKWTAANILGLKLKLAF